MQKRPFDQPSREGISLRMIYAWIILGALIVSGIMFYTTYRLTSTFRRLTDATDQQIALDKAAHELMDASDYLTERVQRFTVNGDRRFLDEYFTEAFETNRREDAIEKMSGDPAIAAALEQLIEAMNDSVELMNREYYAMRLVIEARGDTDVPEVLQTVTLSAEDAARSPEDKMRRATEMVLDDAYYQQKDRIRANMRESLYVLESLTRSTESTALENTRRTMNLVRAVIVLQVLTMILLIWLTLRLGIRPILQAVERIRADRPIREIGANEFRYLARAYNRLTVKLNRENELLKGISQTDALTGIRNRMALRSDYDAYHGREVTVMMLDLDGFKQINDTYGHEEGDRILHETGQLLAATFGPAYCYRYGGDEFLVILPDRSEADFRALLDDMLDRGPVLKDGGPADRVRFSVGSVRATVRDPGVLRKLFSEADEKMYQMKRSKQAAG